MTKQSHHQSPFSSCFGAFYHITQSSSADGICPWSIFPNTIKNYRSCLALKLSFQVNSWPWEQQMNQRESKVPLVAVLELHLYHMIFISRWIKLSSQGIFGSFSNFKSLYLLNKMYKKQLFLYKMTFENNSNLKSLTFWNKKSQHLKKIACYVNS